MILHFHASNGDGVGGELALDFSRPVGYGEVLVADCEGVRLSRAKCIMLGAGVAGAVGAHDPTGASSCIE